MFTPISLSKLATADVFRVVLMQPCTKHSCFIGRATYRSFSCLPILICSQQFYIHTIWSFKVNNLASPWGVRATVTEINFRSFTRNPDKQKKLWSIFSSLSDKNMFRMTSVHCIQWKEENKLWNGLKVRTNNKREECDLKDIKRKKICRWRKNGRWKK
jgi:hypothetical protein